MGVRLNSAAISCILEARCVCAGMVVAGGRWLWVGGGGRGGEEKMTRNERERPRTHEATEGSWVKKTPQQSVWGKISRTIETWFQGSLYKRYKSINSSIRLTRLEMNWAPMRFLPFLQFHPSRFTATSFEKPLPSPLLDASSVLVQLLCVPCSYFCPTHIMQDPNGLFSEAPPPPLLSWPSLFQPVL